jgi:hypothetical protein
MLTKFIYWLRRKREGPTLIKPEFCEHLGLAVWPPNHPIKAKPKMETEQLLALLIPAITQIAHDAITAYYRLHGDQSAKTYADATDEEKQATTAAVTNHINGNPDTQTAQGLMVAGVVEGARGAIETIQSFAPLEHASMPPELFPVPSESIPIPQVTEIHAPTIEPPATPSAPASATPEASPPAADYHPGSESEVPHYPPM